MDTTEFKSLPWFDNNQFLENFLDSIGYNSDATKRIVGAPRVIFWIPIKFWNISSFKAGLYLLKIDINGEIKKVSKIIKL